MFYRVDAVLLFTNEDEARDFYHDCEVALPKASVINPCQFNQECSTIGYHQCFHDEHPATPCDRIASDDNCPECPEV